MQQISKDLNFRGNLRASMAKYNVTNLFDSTFTKTAASLMANTRLGSKVGRVWVWGGSSGGGGVKGLKQGVQLCL